MYISSNLLIQKYIENPLLFLNRKFDIRVFLLIDHLMNLYIFKEGHLKTSSENYDIHSKETFIHITNYSLQKYNPNFQKHEIGNELSFETFQIYLNSIGANVDVYHEIMPKIKEMLKLVVSSVAKKINRKNASYTFEIYGCDLILDKDFNPFLFEINDNPGLSFSSPIIEELVPRLVDDAFRLTIDKIFPTKYIFQCEICKEKINTSANSNDGIDRDYNFPNNDDINKINLAGCCDNNLINEQDELHDKALGGSKNLDLKFNDCNKEKKCECVSQVSSNNLKDNIYKSRFPVRGYSNNENLFEFICNLNKVN